MWKVIFVRTWRRTKKYKNDYWSVTYKYTGYFIFGIIPLVIIREKQR